MDQIIGTSVESDLQTTYYPPKFQKEERAASQIWLRSITSLGLYIVVGYYIFHSLEMLLLITAIVLFHELGHFAAMKFFNYKDLGIFFIPLLGAYVSGTKREVSQKESAIILLAGPMPGIILGAGMYLWYTNDSSVYIGNLSLYTISFTTIILNLVNLFPVYPLDGGQLLNRVFLDEESWVSKVFMWLSIAALAWFAIYGFSRPFYPLLIFPGMLIYRMFGDNSLINLEKKVEESGISLDRGYEDLSNEDYWKIRTLVIANQPQFRNEVPGPPYEYSAKEEKLMLVIEGLLHRNLIQDMSIFGKIICALVWILGILSPWLLQMDLSFLSRFGF